MQKKIALKFNTAFLCFVIAFASVVTFSFAWYGTNVVDIPPIEGGVTYQTKYFQSGDGTSSKKYNGADETDEGCAFEIANEDQFYNLVWLQYMGYFNDQKFYFYLSKDLDMSKLVDENGRQYALPPIGTDSKPFIGQFDGNGHTISNLWTSSDPADWIGGIPRNLAPNESITNVGVFGSITSSSSAVTSSVAGFYLENLKVSTNVSGSVGLIAGYVDGTVDGIGVCRGEIDVKKDTNVYSNFSLLGDYNTDDVGWINRPVGLKSGDLKIIPSIQKGDLYASYNGINVYNITESAPLRNDAHFNGSSAKIIENISSDTVTPGTHYYYNNGMPIQFDGFPANSTKKSITPKSSEVTDITRNTTLIKNDFGTEFYNLWTSTATTKYGYTPSSNPVFSGLSWEDPYPKNCIWFKPLSFGDCIITFLANNMGSSGHMSIYRFERDDTGAIKSNSILEIELTFYKVTGNDKTYPKLKNGDVVSYVIKIPEGDAGKYEYAVGKSSNQTDTNVSFCYLKLAGTDMEYDVGQGAHKSITRVDYVTSTSIQPPVWDKNYSPSAVCYSLSGTATVDETITYTLIDKNTLLVVDSNGNDGVIAKNELEETASLQSLQSKLFSNPFSAYNALNN